uniref:Uncharacterized protein n=1 Tax=Neobacillus citreus TaxID=2833578 RepID=A0A942SWN1_9BACI
MIALLLSGCGSAGAQNNNPVGKVPGDEDTARAETCTVASSKAVDMIDAAVGDHDDTDFASVREGDGGWYLGATITPNVKDDPNDDEVTIWATTSDPTADDFDGPLYPVNQQAKDAVADEGGDQATTAPSDFDPSSDAADEVESCVIQASNR